MRKLRIRSALIALVTLLLAGVFIANLMSIQIIDAETYKQMIGSSSLYRQVVKATRGEIVDKDGEPLAANRMGYDVIIDKATFDLKRGNEIILNLISLFENLGEKWTDNIPITVTAPFSYLPDREDDIARLKSFLNLQDFTSAEDAMYWLDKRYGTEGYSPTEARKIAGVQYEMEQRGFNYSVPYTFATDIGISSVVQIKERGYMLAGVDVIESTVRLYPNGDIAPHLIGLTGPIYAEEYVELKKKGYAANDIVGKSGSELAFEDYLRGKDGTREIFFDASGKVVEAVESVPPAPGNTVKLTISKKMQRAAQEALEKQIKHLQETAPSGEGKEADKGAVVMIECKTGKILACATYPSYDLNRYFEDYAILSKDEELSPLLNRALQGLYSPGSCFKPLIATAGLGTGLVDPSSTVVCGKVYKLPGSPQQFTCLGTHGPINVINALRWSCNIYFYQTGYREGIDLIDLTAKQFGLGEPTGIELTEKQGRRSNPETKMRVEGVEWYPGDVLQSSIGQLHHAYTPLQLANYTATLANRGTRMKLTIVDEIRDYSRQNVILPFEPVIADNVDQSREAFETVTAGMVAASRIGTAAAHFGNYPIDVASKTGTPESAELPNSVFIAFAPADNPVVAIAVVIEKGWHGYTGAPVAKTLFDEYFGYSKPQPVPQSQPVPVPQSEPQPEPQPETQSSPQPETQSAV